MTATPPPRIGGCAGGGEDTGGRKVIKPDDEVAPGEKVVEITPGRVVLEEVSEGGTVTVIVHITEKGQTVQRIMRRAEPGPTLYAPSTVKVKQEN